LAAGLAFEVVQRFFGSDIASGGIAAVYKGRDDDACETHFGVTFRHRTCCSTPWIEGGWGGKRFGTPDAGAFSWALHVRQRENP